MAKARLRTICVAVFLILFGKFRGRTALYAHTKAVPCAFRVTGATACGEWCVRPRIARTARSWCLCAAVPQAVPRAVNMLTDEHRCRRHPDAQPSAALRLCHATAGWCVAQPHSSQTLPTACSRPAVQSPSEGRRASSQTKVCRRTNTRRGIIRPRVNLGNTVRKEAGTQ